MGTQYPGQTRLWWDGREVYFIRWTDSTLVFAWRDTDDTAMHIPRGAVLRLIERGVIDIEGARPDWLQGAIVPDVARPLTLPEAIPSAPRPTPAPAHTRPVLASSRPTPPPSALRTPAPPPGPRPAYPPPPTPAVSLAPVTAPPLEEAPKSRLGIISRLIRKLGGDPARAASLRIPNPTPEGS